jgi:hypothetical protein
LKHAVIVAAAAAFFCWSSSLPARADAIQTFDVEWSGAALGNSARASGLITFNLAVLPNPGGCIGACLPIHPYITALSITVSGASVGNGTFGLSDFSKLSWSTGGSTLDLTQQLVGQPTTISPWGTPCAAADQANCADFNLFSTFAITGTGNPLAPSQAATPSGIAPFLFDTGGGAPPGDRMFLTSFAPVPVPIAGVGLPGLGLAIGGFVFFARRRVAMRRRADTAMPRRARPRWRPSRKAGGGSKQ